ncbi:MAG TPA: hypothetical protein VD967_02010 [Candidatus Paceibacterota bacterium]|nr:hypothetical protein [Candidatus Paceibacterota bacterium]
MRWYVLFGTLLAVLLGAHPASAQDYALLAQKAKECRENLARIGLLKERPTVPWECREEPVRTLKQAFSAELAFLGPDNPGYKKSGGKVCIVLKKVGLPCTYNHRSTLAEFLAVYGKPLFPRDGGTNPYVSASIPTRWPDDVYIGTAKQNAMLMEAVGKNSHLFKNGDLRAEDVPRWRH